MPDTFPLRFGGGVCKVKHTPCRSSPAIETERSQQRFVVLIMSDVNMGSPDTNSGAHGDPAPLAGGWSRQRFGVRQSSAALRTSGPSKSARGLAQSKTWRHLRRFMGRPTGHGRGLRLALAVLVSGPVPGGGAPDARRDATV